MAWFHIILFVPFLLPSLYLLPFSHLSAKLFAPSPSSPQPCWSPNFIFLVGTPNYPCPPHCHSPTPLLNSSLCFPHLVQVTMGGWPHFPCCQVSTFAHNCICDHRCCVFFSCYWLPCIASLKSLILSCVFFFFFTVEARLVSCSRCAQVTPGPLEDAFNSPQVCLFF